MFKPFSKITHEASTAKNIVSATSSIPHKVLHSRHTKSTSVSSKAFPSDTDSCVPSLKNSSSVSKVTNRKNSPQYLKVLNCLDKLTKALSVTPGAVDQLSIKFKQKEWIPVTAKPTANDLMSVALVRIEQNVKDYDEFAHMVNGIPGLQNAADFAGM